MVNLSVGDGACVEMDGRSDRRCCVDAEEERRCCSVNELGIDVSGGSSVAVEDRGYDSVDRRAADGLEVDAHGGERRAEEARFGTSSNPTTLTSSGTAQPARVRALMTPSAIWSFATKTAVIAASRCDAEARLR